MSIDTDMLRAWANIDSTWQLKILTKHSEVKNGTRYHVVWFAATREEATSSRRYRAWLNEGLSPPYRKQHGWEEFDASGAVCDREIRYSKRKDNNYLH